MCFSGYLCFFSKFLHSGLQRKKGFSSLELYRQCILWIIRDKFLPLKKTAILLYQAFKIAFLLEVFSSL